MNYIIHSYEGVNNILFGMSRIEINKLYHGQIKEITRSDDYWDCLEDCELQIAYSGQENLICSTIMLCEPANVFFEKRNLLDGSSLKDLIRWFKTIDPELVITIDGVVSYLHGICLCTEDFRILSDEPLECVVVFAKDFYDYIPTEKSLSQEIKWNDIQW